MKYGVSHMIRIMLADDYEVVRQGLRRILESREGWEICGEASDGRAAVELAMKLKPDVVMMDLSMRELNGLEATRRIRRALPCTEALIFTACESLELIREALAAGARGYILKSESGPRIIEAVEALAGRQPYFTTLVSEALLSAFLAKGSMNECSAFSPLTRRERAVIQSDANSGFIRSPTSSTTRFATSWSSHSHASPTSNSQVGGRPGVCG
jgi:DNA-binding NarL/FixJ family response regulator